MTVAVATPFNMDEQAFLQTMDRLIERFDRYSSGRCFADLDRIRLEHDMEGPLSLFDDVVHELADDLFGGTSWPVNLDMDMIILDRFQIGYDAEFLTGCRNVVRKYGMSAWLYEMINDASVAVATHRPSNRMPFQLGLSMPNQCHACGFRYDMYEARECRFLWSVRLRTNPGRPP